MIYKSLILFLFSISLFAVGCSQSQSEDCEKLKLENQHLRDSITSLITTLKTAELSYWCDQYEIEELQKLGFEDPQKEILENLYNNTQLFSEDGVLGGTMRIDTGMLVGSNYVLALGSDGHLLLYYLLQYKIEDNKQIKWKVLNKLNAIS